MNINNGKMTVSPDSPAMSIKASVDTPSAAKGDSATHTIRYKGATALRSTEDGWEAARVADQRDRIEQVVGADKVLRDRSRGRAFASST